MPTAGERLTSLESDARDACHERAAMAKSITELCSGLESDRADRKVRDEKLHIILHGKDIQQPGLIGEVRLLKSFKTRVGRHFSWFWRLVAATITATVASLVAWGLGLFGGVE